MIPPARANAPEETGPVEFFLLCREGLWELQRDGDRRRRTRGTWSCRATGIQGAKAIASREPRGAILVVPGIPRHSPREEFRFPPHE